MRKELAPKGFALTERLCVYPQYMDPEWMEQGVLDVIKLKYWSFIPRRGSGRRVEETIDGGLAERAIAKGREGEELSEDELTALFAETRPEVIEEMRAAADELRAELAGDRVTFVVNRNINFTNICVVGCAFCGFGQGKRSPDAYEVSEEDFADADPRSGRLRRDRDLHAGRHPPGPHPRGVRQVAAARQAGRAELHLHAYSPMEVHYMCERSGKEPDEVFEYLLECGLGSTPGTAAEVLDDGVRQRISPNKLPVDRWVEIIEASHRAGLRSTSTVMFGHIEEPRELARHMRVVRALQERTGGITEFVPLSFIPFNTMLGRTHGIEEISDGGQAPGRVMDEDDIHIGGQGRQSGRHRVPRCAPPTTTDVWTVCSLDPSGSASLWTECSLNPGGSPSLWTECSPTGRGRRGGDGRAGAG